MSGVNPRLEPPAGGPGAAAGSRAAAAVSGRPDLLQRHSEERTRQRLTGTPGRRRDG
jgi:hypothetical protein